MYEANKVMGARTHVRILAMSRRCGYPMGQHLIFSFLIRRYDGSDSLEAQEFLL